ncbi:head-tail adaptor protein [Sphingomonas sp.]|uniref:head-tail adaptor protein n=1 Tax=Sphingomonas sp. TaxID=28214 RepID=UPI0025DBBCEA|nr:head-tail adaptor protein [Sphingomonas sp.]MBV9529249.1 head-tail adaptor protein [Sphingomonas sp.]
MRSGEFAGTLCERILIEQPSMQRDPSGLPLVGWVSVCTCSASIVPDGVGPQSQGEAPSAMQRFRVTIRRRDGIAIDQRISWGARRLMVRQLLDDRVAKDRISMRCDEVRG